MAPDKDNQLQIFSKKMLENKFLQKWPGIFIALHTWMGTIFWKNGINYQLFNNPSK